MVVTTKRDRLSWIIGALFRMVYGCLTPTDVALSVCKLAVELGWYFKPKGSAEGGSGKSWCDHTGKHGRRENERVLGNLCVPIQDVGWALKLLSETP